MSRRLEVDEKQGPNSISVCVIAGMGFGASLGLLFGISFGNMSYLIIGAVYGAVMGLAIGKSNEHYKEFRSS